MTAKINRRQAMGLTLTGVALVTLGVPARPAFASAEQADAAIKEFAGDAEMAEGMVKLSTPEIAENGNTVPIEVSVESPMTADDYVASVLVVADGNPNPVVVTFNFTPSSGVASAKTRIRLAKTQNVIAVAKTQDGKFYRTSNEVKVTIGGCGG